MLSPFHPKLTRKKGGKLWRAVPGLQSQDQLWVHEESELFSGCINSCCRGIILVGLDVAIDVRNSSSPLSLMQAPVEEQETDCCLHCSSVFLSSCFYNAAKLSQNYIPSLLHALNLKNLSDIYFNCFLLPFGAGWMLHLMIVLHELIFIRIQSENWKIFCGLTESLEIETYSPSGSILFWVYLQRLRYLQWLS